jgi:CBS domain-containing protein
VLTVDWLGLRESLTTGSSVRARHAQIGPTAPDQVTGTFDGLPATLRVNVGADGGHGREVDAMRIQDVLRVKGEQVFSISPDATVTELLASLAERNVGALVVCADDDSVAGIVSERDVVRRLNDRGTAVLQAPVSSIMTTTVTTCTEQDAVEELMRLMTDRRIRHVPVVRDGRLVGVISIGDVVKHRIGELEHERQNLIGYIAGN